MPKTIKLYGLILLILAGVTAIAFNHWNKLADEKYNRLESLYEQKNDSAFLYITKHSASALPLAETMEAIGRTEEDEAPANVQRLIEKAKLQAEEMDEQLLTLIEFSDDYTNASDQQFIVNNAVMATKEQYDMFILAFQARTWRPVYTISYSYWKSKPKELDDAARQTLLALASELRSLDGTLTSFKDGTDTIASEMYVSHSKTQLLQLLRPHLERLKKIQDDYHGIA